MSGNLFVFGYGSLIWKASFPYIQRQPGYIKSFARRFAQSSTDHRGTVDYPGRVTTIIHSDEWEQFAKSHPSGSQDTFPEDDQVSLYHSFKHNLYILINKFRSGV